MVGKKQAVCFGFRAIGLICSAIFVQSNVVHAQSDLRGYTCAQVREAVAKYGGPKMPKRWLAQEVAQSAR